MSFLSFSSSTLPRCVCLSNISCFFLALSHSLSNFSRLLYFDPPLKECHAQAKAILRLFFERVYFVPLCNIKLRLKQWQSWELNFCLCFRFYCASNQFCFSGKALKEYLKCCLMAFFICCSLMWSSLWKHTSLTEQLRSRSVKVISSHQENSVNFTLPPAASLIAWMPHLCHCSVWYSVLVTQGKSVSPNDFRACRQAGLSCLSPSASCLAKSREAIDSGLWKVGRD